MCRCVLQPVEQAARAQPRAPPAVGQPQPPGHPSLSSGMRRTVCPSVSGHRGNPEERGSSAACQASGSHQMRVGTRRRLIVTPCLADSPLGAADSPRRLCFTCFVIEDRRSPPCDRIAKLKLKIKLNDHHLNTSSTFGLTV